MVGFSPAMTFFLAIICIAVALATAALAGALASFCLRLPMRDVWKDVLLGLVAFIAVFLTFVFAGPLHSLVNSDDELPLKAGLFAAASLPILREISQRYRRITNQHS